MHFFNTHLVLDSGDHGNGSAAVANWTVAPVHQCGQAIVRGFVFTILQKGPPAALHLQQEVQRYLLPQQSLTVAPLAFSHSLRLSRPTMMPLP